MEKFDVMKVLGYYVKSDTPEYKRAYHNWRYAHDPEFQSKKKAAGREAYARRCEDKPKRKILTPEERKERQREYQKEYQSRPDVMERKRQRNNWRYAHDETYHAKVLARSNEYQKKVRKRKVA